MTLIWSISPGLAKGILEGGGDFLREYARDVCVCARAQAWEREFIATVSLHLTDSLQASSYV